MFEVSTISRIDTFAKITNSTLVAKIIAETIAILVVAVFFTAKNRAMIAARALKTDGILTENSETPRHLYDRQSSQKNKGGLSQNILPSRYGVIKSFVKSIPRAISAYLVSSESSSAGTPKLYKNINPSAKTLIVSIIFFIYSC